MAASYALYLLTSPSRMMTIDHTIMTPQVIRPRFFSPEPED
jgi:hypothetical protein